MIDIEKFKAHLESPEGKESMRKYVEKLIFKQDLKLRNVERIKKMFNSQESFDLLVNKIIDKHDDSWRDRCYKKGVEPHPWELLYALFTLVETDGEDCEPIDGLTEHFPSLIYNYQDWQFAITHGQGSVCSVYYKKELMYRD